MVFGQLHSQQMFMYGFWVNRDCAAILYIQCSRLKIPINNARISLVVHRVMRLLLSCMMNFSIGIISLFTALVLSKV